MSRLSHKLLIPQLAMQVNILRDLLNEKSSNCDPTLNGLMQLINLTSEVDVRNGIQKVIDSILSKNECGYTIRAIASQIDMIELSMRDIKDIPTDLYNQARDLIKQAKQEIGHTAPSLPPTVHPISRAPSPPPRVPTPKPTPPAVPPGFVSEPTREDMRSVRPIPIEPTPPPPPQEVTSLIKPTKLFINPYRSRNIDFLGRTTSFDFEYLVINEDRSKYSSLLFNEDTIEPIIDIAIRDFYFALKKYLYEGYTPDPRTRSGFKKEGISYKSVVSLTNQLLLQYNKDQTKYQKYDSKLLEIKLQVVIGPAIDSDGTYKDDQGFFSTMSMHSSLNPEDDRYNRRKMSTFLYELANPEKELGANNRVFKEATNVTYSNRTAFVKYLYDIRFIFTYDSPVVAQQAPPIPVQEDIIEFDITRACDVNLHIQPDFKVGEIGNACLLQLPSRGNNCVILNCLYYINSKLYSHMNMEELWEYFNTKYLEEYLPKCDDIRNKLGFEKDRSLTMMQCFELFEHLKIEVEMYSSKGEIDAKFTPTSKCNYPNCQTPDIPLALIDKDTCSTSLKHMNILTIYSKRKWCKGCRVRGPNGSIQKGCYHSYTDYQFHECDSFSKWYEIHGRAKVEAKKKRYLSENPWELFMAVSKSRLRFTIPADIETIHLPNLHFLPTKYHQEYIDLFESISNISEEEFNAKLSELNYNSGISISEEQYKVFMTYAVGYMNPIYLITKDPSEPPAKIVYSTNPYKHDPVITFFNNLEEDALRIANTMDYVTEITYVIPAYNGSNFDFYAFFSSYLSKITDSNSSILITGSSIRSGKWTKFITPHLKVVYELYDPAGFVAYKKLKDICKILETVVQKGEFDHKKMRTLNDLIIHRTEACEYLFKDVLSFCDVIVKLHTLFGNAYSEFFPNTKNRYLHLDRFVTGQHLVYEMWAIFVEQFNEKIKFSNSQQTDIKYILDEIHIYGPTIKEYELISPSSFGGTVHPTTKEFKSHYIDCFFTEGREFDYSKPISPERMERMCLNLYEADNHSPISKELLDNYYKEPTSINKHFREWYKIIKIRDDYEVCLDVCSLYPAAMCGTPFLEVEYGIGIPRWVDKEEALTYLTASKESGNRKWGFLKCKILTPNTKSYYARLPEHDKFGMMRWNLLPKTNYSLSTIDFYDALDTGFISSYELEEKDCMLIYDKTHKGIFKNFIIKFFNMKEAATDDAMREICKLIINALFGKMLQRPIKESYIVTDDYSELMNFRKDNFLTGERIDLEFADDGLPVKSIFTGERKDFESCLTKPMHLGVAILAYARCIMNYHRIEATKKGFEHAGWTYSINEPLPVLIESYTDTDSIFTTGNELHYFDVRHKQLGYLASEEDKKGIALEAIRLGPKMYAFIGILNNCDKIDKLTKKLNETQDSEEIASLTKEINKLSSYTTMNMALKGVPKVDMDTGEAKLKYLDFYSTEEVQYKFNHFKKYCLISKNCREKPFSIKIEQQSRSLNPIQYEGKALVKSSITNRLHWLPDGCTLNNIDYILIKPSKPVQRGEATSTLEKDGLVDITHLKSRPKYISAWMKVAARDELMSKLVTSGRKDSDLYIRNNMCDFFKCTCVGCKVARDFFESTASGRIFRGVPLNQYFHNLPEEKRSRKALESSSRNQLKKVG